MVATAVDGLRVLSRHLSKHWADPIAAKSNWSSNTIKATILGSLPKVITIRDREYSSHRLDETGPPSSGPGDKDELQNGDLPVNQPSLELVVVPRDENDRVDLSSKGHNFAKIIAASNIDPVIHQHIYLCSYGFYHYDSDGLIQAAGQSRSFYFGCFLYSIAWSFDPATMKTTGIIILRTVKRHNYGALPLEMLEGVLKVYSGFLASPLFLAFASFIMLAHVLDDNVYRNVDLLRHVERDTEHGPGREGPRMFYKQSDNLSDVSIGDGDEMPGMERQDTVILEDKTDNINKLTEVSQQLADINVHLANLQRHVKFLMTMAETLEDGSFREYQFDGVPSGLLDSAGASTEELLLALPSLKRRILAVEPSIEYLQDRAKSLSQVVSGLLTHEDAEVNINVAERARKDSSAMKTIALMTMLFLPGTFYAAVFAMPILKWSDDAPGVIQREFWVFWAFTIPSTVLVMIASALHNKRKKIVAKGKRWAKEWKVRRAQPRGRQRKRDVPQLPAHDLEKAYTLTPKAN